MRIWRVLAVALVSLVAASALWAKTSADWSEVERIKWDSPLRMELWSGQEYVGRFDSADGTTFRLKVRANDRQGQTATVETFARGDVRIVEVRGGRSGRDPGNTIRAGMLVGAVGGAIAAGVAMGKAWPVGAFVGGFAGAGAGALGGGIVAIAKDTPRTHVKIVYESQQRPQVAHPPAPLAPLQF